MEQKQRIVALHKIGCNISEIMNKTNLSVSIFIYYFEVRK